MKRKTMSTICCIRRFSKDAADRDKHFIKKLIKINEE